MARGFCPRLRGVSVIGPHVDTDTPCAMRGVVDHNTEYNLPPRPPETWRRFVGTSISGTSVTIGVARKEPGDG